MTRRIAVPSTRERVAMLEATQARIYECAMPIDETRLALSRCGRCQEWCGRAETLCRRCRRAP